MMKFFRMSLVSFKALLGWLNPKLYIIYKVIDPALQMIFYTLLIRYVYNTEDITPWILGNAFLLCTRNAVFAIGGMLRNDREQGTLQVLVASPINKLFVFIARGFFNVLDAALTVIVGLLIGVMLFGLNLSGINIWVFSLSIITAMLGGMGVGLLLGSIALVMRDIHLFLNVANMLLYILTGASFPRSKLPSMLHFFSNVVPITRSLEASRIIASNGSAAAALKLIAVDVAIGGTYILIGFLIYGYIEHRARVLGTLEAY